MNEEYKTLIKVEDHDMIKKLAYLYWYEHQNKDGWGENRHEDLYNTIKNQVMEYGYGFFKDS